jgi:transcriptional regulator
MYVPKHFEVADAATLAAFLRANPFATMVSLLNGEMIATHLPVLLDGDAAAGGRLVGHVARANPHWQAFDGATESLVIFAGPHAYVSPAWYDISPAVPTWNYAAVHVYGVARALEDAEALAGIVDRLTEVFDRSGYGPKSVSPEYKAGMLRGIVGFELQITRVQGKYKLSQNRSLEDRRSVVHHLEQSPHGVEQALAGLMQAHLGQPETR